MAGLRDLPLFAVQEATGFFVTVEAADGSTYKGKLTRMDPLHGDVELSDVRCQRRDSSLSVEGRVYLKGSDVRLVHLPSDLKRASFLEWNNTSVQKDLKNNLRPRITRTREGKRTKATKSKQTKQQKLKRLL